MRRPLILLALFVCASCGSPQPTNLAGGSWGGDVGGSFYDTDTATLTADFRSARILWVQKYVMPLVWHEFLAIVVNHGDGRSVHTGGLVAADDMSYFADLSESSNMIVESINVRSTQQLTRIKHRYDRLIDGLALHNGTVFFMEMLLAPVRGRPCATVAEKAMTTMRSALTDLPDAPQ